MDKVTFFPVGNGDTTMFEVDGKVIITDCHYRKKCQDENNDDYDFGDDVRNACVDGLDIFVLTHPDKDHLLGTGELFHLGKPGDCPSDKILIKEIWCSPYATDPAYTTDDSKPLLDEIKRRKGLSGADSTKDGNRLKILSLDKTPTFGSVTSKIFWRLLAPSDAEAAIEAGDEDKRNSSNDSSVVIQWTLTSNGHETKLLLGGDATVEIWDRIWDDNCKQKTNLEWDILLTPHHCSRGALARKNDDDKYEYSDKANSALGQMRGCGYAIASSKEVKRNDDNPPSWEAKRKYLNILEKPSCSLENERFINPAVHGEENKPAPVVFELSSSGITKKGATKKNAAGAALGSGAVSPSKYG